VVDEDELAHAPPREPPTQLGADRAAGAGDQDGRVSEVRAEPPEVDIDDRATEKRFDRDLMVGRTPVPQF
jgi:hypothetical protein